MLGVDNYIVESDNISKLTKAIKDVSFDETEEDKCNQKSEKVRQKVLTISLILAGGKIFNASQLSVLYAQAHEIGEIRLLVSSPFHEALFSFLIKWSLTFLEKNCQHQCVHKLYITRFWNLVVWNEGLSFG